MKFDVNKLTKEKQYCEELFSHYIKIKAIRKTNPDYKKYINKAVSNLELANFILEEHNFSIKKSFLIENTMTGALLFITIQSIILP